ncbi:MAG TPA: helix-turn-helix transcriptional regulator [Candidatus Binatia bacterium]
MNPKQNLASRLRDARLLSGLSQAQVASRLNLHRPTISEIEAGRRSVATEELKRFSELYGVTMAWLLGETDETRKDSRDALVMAARELGKIREEDLDRLLRVIRMVRTSGSK